LWRSNEQVHREWGGNFPAYFDCLTVPVPRRHDHENIHVAVLVGCAVGVRAEQYDLVGLESLRHRAREAPDDPHRHIGAPINPIYSRWGRLGVFICHVIILADNLARRYSSINNRG
jgi:hypothetical protein